jgi:hypothetical protein
MKTNKFYKSRRILEFVQADFEPISSFYIQDDLNRNIWDGDKLKKNIRKDLIEISQDYIDFLEIDIDIIDIQFTGSLANYNWSDFSDYDLHIILDKSKINDDRELVEKYLENSEKLWKYQHEINIKGYPVEIFCQDVKDEGISTGVYSLIKDKWIIKPTKKDFKPDEILIKKKASRFMDAIDELKEEFEDGKSYKEVKPMFKSLWKKIKDFRKSGLKDEGEFSIENLVFKLLRRNGYIQKFQDLKRKYYDQQFK